MREIKFRAWDKKNKRMGQVWRLDIINDSGTCFDIECLDDEGKGYSDYEIMQYTGLKDKKGVEIFEGDILVCLTSKPSEVKFIDGCFFFMDKNTIDKKVAFYVWKRMLEGQGEVIGNIWANPELLENGNDP